jgi:hypothetical protein
MTTHRGMLQTAVPHLSTSNGTLTELSHMSRKFSTNSTKRGSSIITYARRATEPLISSEFPCAVSERHTASTLNSAEQQGVYFERLSNRVAARQCWQWTLTRRAMSRTLLRGVERFHGLHLCRLGVKSWDASILKAPRACYRIIQGTKP